MIGNKFDLSQDPLPFRFSVKSIENIAYEPPKEYRDDDVAPFVTLSFTLYNKESGKFFGRTYETKALRLKENV